MKVLLLTMLAALMTVGAACQCGTTGVAATPCVTPCDNGPAGVAGAPSETACDACASCVDSYGNDSSAAAPWRPSYGQPNNRPYDPVQEWIDAYVN